MEDCVRFREELSREEFFVSISCGVVRHLLSIEGMVTKQIIRAASGWLELGLPEDALEELEGLPPADRDTRKALEVKLAAQMAKSDWKPASETAVSLCTQGVEEAEYFVSAAYCFHEIGDTEEARKWLQRGPESLSEMPVYHYNMACYLWKLGEGERARNHLAKAIEMDESFMESARHDKDLVGMEF